MNRILFSLCLLFVSWGARGQSAYDWLYWFDSNEAPQHQGTVNDGAFSIDIDAEGLSEGLHTIHVQIADTASRYSPPVTKYFYYTPDNKEATLS